MISPELLKVLKETEKKYNETENELCGADIPPDRIVSLSREISRLSETVATYREYTDTLRRMEENMTLLEDSELGALARTEVGELEEKLRSCESRLMELLVPKDPNDARNAILEIRAATGGEEAALFAASLLRMYSRYCEGRSWSLSLMALSETGIGGIREAVAAVEGKGVFENLKYESGVHRVQRIPVTETGGRIHTSTATVAVLAEPVEVEVEIDEKDLKVDTYRASGPGGQHVNKTDSAVRITHIPTGIIAQCQSERSQHKNRAQTMRMLRAKIYELECAKQRSLEAGERKKQLGGGERSEKIRTYNFPQSRVTDHRTGITLSNIDEIMNGDIEKIIGSLREKYRAESLVNQNPS